MDKLRSLLHPMLNPTGYMAAAGAIYAVAVMVYNAVNHHGIISIPVIVAAIGAVAALFTHQIVTPVKAPKNGAGVPLVPVHQLVTMGTAVNNPPVPPATAPPTA